MSVTMRQPIVAGRFYSGSQRGCLAQLQRIDDGPPDEAGLPDKIVATIVPHAGWDCSGRLAMRAFRAARKRLSGNPTFVIFGAVHSFGVARASVYARGGWQTPLGPMSVDEELAAAILEGRDSLIIDDPHAHAAEHSIEVQLPMLLYIFGDVKFVPIAVPPRDGSHLVGEIVARQAADLGRDVFYVGTTDLTHYGRTGYGFAPHGIGCEGLNWVKSENDPRIIRLMEQMKAEEVVEESRRSYNACGGGAIAATLAAARSAGSKGGRVIDYTTSYDVLKDEIYGDRVSDFVGYVSMVF